MEAGGGTTQEAVAEFRGELMPKRNVRCHSLGGLIARMRGKRSQALSLRRAFVRLFIHCVLHITRRAAQFARVFKKEHGVTLRDYIKKARLARAQYLLEESDRSIQDVAFEVGYEEISLFNRIFKTGIGLTPSDYRARKK